MLDVGFQELIIIFVVALVVFGPKRLPEIGRSLGKGIGELRRTLEGIKTTINAEERDLRRSVLDDTARPEPSSPDEGTTPSPAQETTAAGAVSEHPASPYDPGTTDEGTVATEEPTPQKPGEPSDG